MEFAQRNNAAPAGAPAPNRASNTKTNKKWASLMRWGTVVLVVSGAILLVALLASIVFSKPNKQSKYVNDNQYQAVFLNGGQVYFGKISELNTKYIALNNIYYLRVNQTVQPTANTSNPNDVSLVKLGCELHGPNDQMVINTDQVIFWENLKADGQVAKAVAEFIKQNPKGQDCTAASAAANAASANSTGTTPATTPTTKKQ